MGIVEPEEDEIEGIKTYKKKEKNSALELNEI